MEHYLEGLNWDLRTQGKSVKLAEDCQNHLFGLKSGRISSDLTVVLIGLSDDTETRYGVKYLAEIEGADNKKSTPSTHLAAACMNSILMFQLNKVGCSDHPNIAIQP